MAQLLLIKAETYLENINEIDDIVGIFRDSHIFDPNELNLFNILKIPGISDKELHHVLTTHYPETAVWKLQVNRNKWSINPPEEKRVWKNPLDNKWYFKDVKPKYRFSLKNVTIGERDLLKNISTPKSTKLSLAQSAILYKASELIENKVECTDIN